MTKKRTRDRQLAKQAARRQEERRAAKRRRNVALGAAGIVAAIVLVVVGFSMLRSDEPEDMASPSVTDTASSEPTDTQSQAGGLPQEVRTVTAEAQPADPIACGGERPAAADEPKPQFDRAPDPRRVLDDGVTYTAVMETSCGTIEIDLDAEGKPETVASFVFLAEQGYFDGTFFHRVVDSIDVVQGGDPLGTGTGGPGYSIPDELVGDESYVPGTVAMANAGPDTGGSQFFLITGDAGQNLDLSPNYTIFGDISGGLDVAEQINALMPSAGYDGSPTEAVYVESVTIRETS